MERQRVASSDISSIGYAEGTLEIRFHSGGTYQYFGVSEDVYHALMTAVSHGSYFQKHIRGRYRFKKIS